MFPIFYPEAMAAVQWGKGMEESESFLYILRKNPPGFSLNIHPLSEVPDAANSCVS